MTPSAPIETRWFYALMPSRASEAIFSLLFPLFLLDVLHAHVGTVGLFTGLISLTAVPGAILWGSLSDRLYKRREFLILGYIGSGVCLAGMGLVSSLPLMAFLCLAYGVFSSAPGPIPSALIMETTPQDHWDEAFGTFNKIGGWGWVGGLAVGGGLLPLSHFWLPEGGSKRTVFLLLAVITWFSAWQAQRTLPKSLHQIPRERAMRVTRRVPALSIVERALYLPRNLLFVLHPAHLARLGDHIPRPYRRYLLATSLVFMGSTVAFTLLTPFLHEVLHLHSSLIFALAFARLLAATLCFEPAGRWEHYAGPKRVQLWAVGVRTLGFLGFWSLWTLQDSGLQLGVLLSVSIIVGMTWSALAISGPVLVGYLGAPGKNGTAMGIYTAAQGVSGIVGALMGGYLAQEVGYISTFALAACLVALAIGPLSRLRLLENPGHETPAPAA
jgi:MFS family permease